MVMVTATDPAGESAVIPVTIDVVDDANEPPRNNRHGPHL